MAYTADGKKIRKGMNLWDRPTMGNRRVTVQSVVGDNILIGNGIAVHASGMYSSEESLSIANKVLIFGGTFDPIHNGHLIACRAVAEGLGINRVILIPSGKHPYKHDITSIEDRFRMVDSVEDNSLYSNGHLFETCNCEFNREGFSYSAETAVWIKEELRKRMKEVYWMVGADNITQIPKWYKSEKFVQEVRFAVANRKTSNSLFEGTEEEQKIMDMMDISYVDTPIIEISSSMIRERVKRGLPITYLVPDSVEKYIIENNLYK